MKTIYGLLLLVVILVPSACLAQQLTDPIVPSSVPITMDRFEVLARRIASFLIMISIVLSVIFLTFGGISYMVAGADESRVASAKLRIWHAIGGTAVVLGVGLILQTLSSILNQTFFGV
jgi:hypothetical protein